MTFLSRLSILLEVPVTLILLAIALACTPGGLCTSSARAAQPEPSRRPNILFLMTDDQRFDTLGCMGNRIIQTPHLDRLAAEGVVFNNAFVTTSVCAHARASVLTGQYCARHGMTRFFLRSPFGPNLTDSRVGWEFTAGQAALIYPALLKQAGYRTGFIGKWGVGPTPKGVFDFLQNMEIAYHQKREDGSYVHLTRLMGERAMEFLDQAAEGDAPFCLSISFRAPHIGSGEDVHGYASDADRELSELYRDVVIPPPPLGEPAFFEAMPAFLRQSENRRLWKMRFATPERYQETVKGYYRLITGVDNAVGRILKRLDKLGLDDNTVIIFTTDNGFYLGARGFTGKWYAHEFSMRAPLIIFDPRYRQQQGTRRDQMVLNIDMAPTMLDLAGVSVSRSMQGVSLAPILRGESPSWRKAFFYEYRLTPHSCPLVQPNEGVRTSRWKYIRFVDVEPPYEELYDLSADPDEARNLAGDPKFQAVIEDMRTKWAKWHERVR